MCRNGSPERQMVKRLNFTYISFFHQIKILPNDSFIGYDNIEVDNEIAHSASANIVKFMKVHHWKCIVVKASICKLKIPFL